MTGSCKGSIACSGENWAVSALSVKQIRTLQGNVLLDTQRQVNELVQYHWRLNSYSCISNLPKREIKCQQTSNWTNAKVVFTLALVLNKRDSIWPHFQEFEVYQNYFSKRRIFNSFPSVWKCAQTRSLVFYILLAHWGLSGCIKGRKEKKKKQKNN